MSSIQLPPPLPLLNTEEFRQKLAGLVDPRSELSSTEIAAQRDYAVEFVSALPIVFGDSLDRTTLWDRIGTALEIGYAKTVGDDVDFFISAVLEHIKANAAAVARCEKIAGVIAWLASCTSEEKHTWLAYMATHRYAVLVRGRSKWEASKVQKEEANADL